MKRAPLLLQQRESEGPRSAFVLLGYPRSSSKPAMEDEDH